MSDSFRVDAKTDPVAKFCGEISVPLEVIANALFLATPKGADSRFTAQMLQLASNKLQDVRNVVSANCRLDEATVVSAPTVVAHERARYSVIFRDRDKETQMSRPPQAPSHSANENVEHHSNISDDSRATLNADVGPSDAVDIAQEERLEILIESDVSHPVPTNEKLRTGSTRSVRS